MKRLFSLLALCLLPVACTSVKSTAVYYTPATPVVYPPKPPEAVIPILDKPPARPYAVIGRFGFQSDLGRKFMMKAVEYNARRVGADAVILMDDRSRTVAYPYGVPATRHLVPVTGRCGRTVLVPYFEPGYSGVMYDSVTGIDARMIVFRPQS